jgi:TolB-like protein/Flp pilus assembly protein TadD
MSWPANSIASLGVAYGLPNPGLIPAGPRQLQTARPRSGVGFNPAPRIPRAIPFVRWGRMAEKGQISQGHVLRFGNFELRPGERSLLVDGQAASLGSRAFDMLLCLIEHRDRVVSKDELLERVWPGTVVEESNLTVHIAALRKLLGPTAIATISGRGYRFTATLTAALNPTAGQLTPMRDESAPPPSMPQADRPSLAVLPFLNLSGDMEQDYFVDGVVDDIINALSRVRSFFVIARSSSFTYKGRVVDAPQVGRELGVRYLVEGSFRQAGPRLRIGVQLVETVAGRLVWSQRFEGAREDIFELQDQITEQVVAAIEPNLMAAELELSRTRPTEALQAYELCLRALPLVQASATRQTVEEAIALLRQAIAMDGDYAYAKALYCYAHAVAYASRWFNHEQARHALPMAEEVLLDHRDNPASLAYVGHYLAYVGREHDKGLQALDRALALNPNSFAALHSSGWIRAYVGDAKGAIELLQRALRANPLAPEFGHGLSALGYAYLVDSRIDEALTTLQKAYIEAPTFGITQIAMAWCLARLDRREEASTIVARLLAHDQTLRVSTFCAIAPFAEAAFEAEYVALLKEAGVPS